MAQFLFSIALSLVVMCDSSRIKTRSQDAPEPAWCKAEASKGCSSAIEKKCPRTCTGLVKEEQVVNRSVSNNVISMEAVTERMRALHLNQVRRSDLYQQAWPVNCKAENAHGGIVQNLNTDRFLCDSVTKQVPSIVTPGWLSKWKNFACCDGECIDHLKCTEKPYTFTEAAKAALSRKALEATQLKTPGGRTVQVNIEESTHEEFSATGVLAQVEVRLFGSDLEFKVAMSEFKPASLAFFDDMIQALGPLISMQISAFDVPVKTVLCAHSETSRRSDELRGAHLHDLPLRRATALRDRLEQFVPEEGELGEPIGHYSEEVENYFGGRRAFIVYKIFDKRTATPKCELGDLHLFLTKHADDDQDD